MGERTKIGWCDHTFNAWWGCLRVSEACEHCYAEAFAKRVGLDVWGARAPRRFFGDKHWNEPRKWNEAARRAGKRARVFCSSMADVFERYEMPPILVDQPGVRRLQLLNDETVAGRDLDAERRRLFQLIEETDHLDWLLLTKRIENVAAMVPKRWMEIGFPPNVWIGTTAESQKRLEQRIMHLLSLPADVRFLSVEPQLGPITLRDVELVAPEPPFKPRVALDALLGHVKGPDEMLHFAVDWVICGGESGPKARPFRVEWARALMNECSAVGVPFFMKQFGARPAGEWGGRKLPMPSDRLGRRDEWILHHPKGEDMAEWPEDLRVQEWPS